MDIWELLYLKTIENSKVAKALSDKLQTEVDKNSIIETISRINVGDIIYAGIKKTAIKLENITSNAESVADYIYSGKIFLQSLELPIATSIGNNAIQNCISLQSLELPMATSIGNYAIQNCISLQSLELPMAMTIGNGAMYSCVSLQNLELPIATSIGNYALYNCTSLITFKIGTNEVATLSNVNAFTDTPIAKGTGYIYVPDELVDSYKTATNWSAYADQIRPMSECEVENE